VSEGVTAVQFASTLRELTWVPALAVRPSPYLPWPIASQDPLCPLARPATLRPSSELWLCSASYRILAADVASLALKDFFQFSVPLSPSGG
jgi:sacsin